MLVPPLQVEVGRPGKSGLAPQNRCLARTGLEPHIDDVHLLTELCAAALRALGSRGQNLLGRMLVPGIRTFPSEQLDNGAIHRLAVQKFVAALALEHGDRHTPEALARDAPVRTRGNHVRDALLAPRRVPSDLLDLFQRTAAQRSAA